MQTYVVVRRSAWPTVDEQREADIRSAFEAARMADDIECITSYVLEESDLSLGTVCIFQAANPEAVRRHAAAADLPVDEIVKVLDTVLARPDPTPTPS
jgi:hypothetical protein